MNKPKPTSTNFPELLGDESEIPDRMMFHFPEDIYRKMVLLCETIPGMTMDKLVADAVGPVIDKLIPKH